MSRKLNAPATPLPKRTTHDHQARAAPDYLSHPTFCDVRFTQPPQTCHQGSRSPTLDYSEHPFSRYQVHPFDPQEEWRMVPEMTQRILERTLDMVKLRANSNGECLGGEIMDSLREAGVDLGAHHIESLHTRSLLVRTMESLGEAYPAEMLQDYENRIQLSKVLRFLNTAIDWTTGQRGSDQDV